MKTECISEEALMDYFDGKLIEEEKVAIENHLSECDDCLELMTIIHKMAKDSENSNSEWVDMKPVPEHVTQKAIESVWSVADDSIKKKKTTNYLSRLFSIFIDKIIEMFTFRPLVQAAVRSNKKASQQNLFIVNKKFSDLEADIEFEKKSLNLSSIRISIVKNPIPAELLRVTLYSGDREVSSFHIQESAITFQDIPLGRYTLVILRSGEKLGSYSFEVKDTSIGKNETGGIFFQSDSIDSNQR